MKKAILKGLAVLYAVLLIGTVLVSCGPIFDVGGVNGGDNGNGEEPEPPPPGPPADGYTAVKAYDGTELAEYLQSDEISYAITLEPENNDIYLPRNVSIVKPMKIIGSVADAYTIHSIGRAGGSAFFSLALQADLEIENCSFIGYNGASGGSPPLNIEAGRTLTMKGNNSVLEFRGVGSASAIRTGSQVKLGDGVSIVDESVSGDLLFRTGVEKLIISGKVSIKNKLTVGEKATLQVDNDGELRVGPGTTLTINENIKELRIDGIIVVDRTASPGGVLVTPGLAEGTLLEKITGASGSLNIENGVVGEEDDTPFRYGANTIIKLSSAGISMGKRVSSGVGGVINTTDALIIPKGKKLVVDTGTDLNVYHELTLKGGTLDVAGKVNVTTNDSNNGQIILIAEDRLTATPKGSVDIGASGTITIDSVGAFKDETWDNATFTLPSYGAGSLIIKSTQAYWGTATSPLVIGVNSTFTIRTVSGAPEITLAGNGTLNVTGGLSLVGRFIVAGDSTLTISVSGSNPFTVASPNQLSGSNTANQQSPILHIVGGTVIINSGTYNSSTYVWYGSPPSWS